MKKKAQHTVLDNALQSSPAHWNKQNDLPGIPSHVPGYSRPKENFEPLSPSSLKFPEVSVEEMKSRSLTPQEEKRVDEEIESSQEAIGTSSYYSIWEKQNIEKLERFKKLNELPNDLKIKIAEKYKILRDNSVIFYDKYKEANEYAALNNEINYTNVSYEELFLNFPKFVVIEITKEIGRLFGFNEKQKRYKSPISILTDALGKNNNQGLSVFNITAINFDQKINQINKLNQAIIETIENYEKRKKVLKKLEQILTSEISNFLSIEDNKNFLKWMDEAFPDDKKAIIDSIVRALRQDFDHSDNLNFGQLKKIKTYKSIYEKSSNLITKLPLDRAKNKANIEIEGALDDLISEEVSNILNKIKHDCENFKVSIDNPNKPGESKQVFDVIKLSKYLNNLIGVDILSIFNFFRNFASKMKYQNESFNFLLITKFSYDFEVKFLNSQSSLTRNTIYSLRKKFKTAIEMSKLTKNDIKPFILDIFKTYIIDSLPSNNLYYQAYETFVNVKTIASNVGKLSIENLTNVCSNIVPEVPKENFLHLVKAFFKNSNDDIIGYITKLVAYKDSKPTLCYLNLLKKFGKLSLDNFTNNIDKINYINSAISKIELDLKINKEEAIELIKNSIRNLDTFDQDFKNLITIIEFFHNSASNLKPDQIKKIISNKNFVSYSKTGIAKKLLNAYVRIKNEGGLKGIISKYKTTLTELKRKNFVSKKFNENISFIENYFESNVEINPKSENFQEIFTLISTAETDLELLQMGDVLQELFKDYEPKNKKLFKLDYQINPNLRFRVLKDKDPRILQIGIETNCCQRIGGVGEVAARDSFVNPLAGVLVLEWQDNGQWRLLAQSYFHYVPVDNGYILDNIESNQKNVQDSGLNLAEIYAYYANKVADKLKIKYFLAGKGYSKVDTSKFKTNKSKTDPRSFSNKALTKKDRDHYSDFDEKDSMDLLAPKFKIDQLTEKFTNTQLSVATSTEFREASRAIRKLIINSATALDFLNKSAFL